MPMFEANSNKNPLRYSPLRTNLPTEIGPTSSCPQIVMKDHLASFGMSSPAVVGFLDWNCRYKSVATQMHHDA